MLSATASMCELYARAMSDSRWRVSHGKSWCRGCFFYLTCSGNFQVIYIQFWNLNIAQHIKTSPFY